MVEIFLVRHGQTDWNLQRRLQGHTDVPLNDLGREQARKLREVLAEYKIDAFYTSDLQRARETAELARFSEETPVIIDRGLREAALGEAEGLHFDDLHLRFPDCYTQWLSTGERDQDFSFPGGESKLQHRQRMISTMEQLFSTHPFRRVAIVTHGGAMRRVLESAPNFTEGVFRTHNTSVYNLHYCLSERRLHFIKKIYSPE